MIAWLKWWLCRDELTELDRWRLSWWEARRWFAEFPDAADALDHMEAEAKGEECDFIDRVRDRMRRRRDGVTASHRS